MIGRVFRSKALARLAVIGLALGVFALAGLAVVSTNDNARTTSHVRHTAEISDQWGQFNLHVSLEYEALTDYVRAGSEVGRQPLVSAIGSATDNLAWLAQHGEADDVEQAGEVAGAYASYTQTLRDFVATGGSVGALADQASLSASTLRKSAMANVSRTRLDTDAYLSKADLHNQRLRTSAWTIFGLNSLQLLLCALILFTHQRRIEGQAVESRHRALHDGLTGLANRTLLTDQIERSLRMAGRHQDAVGLLLLDLNKFKEVNDTLGHHAGDLLLQEVAARLTAAVRVDDTVARLGGDEFAVLLPAVGTPEDCLKIGRRLLAELEGPADLGGVLVDISGSIGAATFPADSADSAELLQHADIAMYAAKRRRLGAALYDPADDHHSSQQLGLLGELRRAIDEGELVLHYQPKVATGTGEVVGVEALVRWQHPARGLLAPMDFIPQAEESDIIRPLTDAILALALKQHSSWRAAGTVLPIAVNTPTACLHDISFPDRVAAALAGHDVPATMLTLEITETSIITDPEGAAAVLLRLRDLGVRLSVDDFGTGYSSMTYLQGMPLTELKIDRSFIREIHQSGSDAAIVRAILQLAAALELEVVAEGVETAAALAMLERMGCAYAQGYFLSRPLPAGDLLAWLAARPSLLTLEV